MGEKKNKSRAGMCNIGYTSSMNASLQALMSVYNDEYLVNAKGKLAI
jgi:ubiquitin C-terminal hydrolase